MKKIVIGLAGLLIVVFVVIKIANAQNSSQEVTKATTETKMDCGKCPSTTACAKMAGAKSSEVKACDPAKCKEMGCDPAKCKKGKCDPEKCLANCANAKGETKKCNPAMCSRMSKKKV
jgi:hypothetical protein